MMALRGKLPELLLLLACILMAAGKQIHYLPAGGAALILLLLLSRNRILGITIGMGTLLVALLLFLAVLSEYTEFPAANKEALSLLGMGSLLTAVLGIVGLLLLRKYTKKIPAGS